MPLLPAAESWGMSGGGARNWAAREPWGGETLIGHQHLEEGINTVPIFEAYPEPGL